MSKFIPFHSTRTSNSHYISYSLYDVKFFTIECLIVLLSSSMYKTNYHTIQPHHHFNPNQFSSTQAEQYQSNTTDIFSHYLYRKSIVEMKMSYSIPNDSIFFSKILSIRLIKSLVQISVAAITSPTTPNTTTTSTTSPPITPSLLLTHFQKHQQQQQQFIDFEQRQGQVLSKIYKKILEEHVKYLQETRPNAYQAHDQLRKLYQSPQKSSLSTLLVKNNDSDKTSGANNTPYDNVVSIVRQMLVGE